SGMRAAPAEVQSGHRGPVRRPTGEWPEGEELVRGHVDLIDASAGQTPFPFHVEGREDLPPLDRMSEIRSERDEGLEDCVANFFLPIVPGPGPQPVRRVLRVHRQRGFARRRQLGSVTEWRTQSRNGSREGSPHFASSQAFSRYSMDGQTSIYPR